MSAVFTLDLVGVLDPLSFLYRSFAVGVFPGLTHARLGAGRRALRAQARVGRPAGLPCSRSLTAQRRCSARASSSSLLFARRRWASTPRRSGSGAGTSARSGALLGVFSRWNVFKVRVEQDKCIKCRLCTTHCETQAVPYPNEKWRSAECVYCETCAAICPTAAITYPADRPAGEARHGRPITPEAHPDDGARGDRSPDLQHHARPQARRPQAHPAAGRPRRGGFRPEVRQVRGVHEGLPDQRPPAGPPRGGPGRALDADARAADRLLRILLLALHAGLPDRGHPQAQDRGKDDGQDRLRLDQQGPVHPLRPGQARASSARSTARPRPRRSSS